MTHRWALRCPFPDNLVHPLPTDPTGEFGPTPSAARCGGWRQTSTGLFVPSAVDSTLVEQRILEVAASLPPGAAVTGWASLRWHGGNHFDGLGPRMEQLPVSVALPLDRDVRSHPSLDKLRSPLGIAEIVELHNVWVTEPNRALFDLMARSPDRRAAAVHGSVACSAGLVSLPEFKEYVGGRRCIAGIVKVRKALKYVDDRVRSPREAELLLVWCLEAGLSRPLMNWPVYDSDGTYLGAADGLSPELALYGEYDSSDHGPNEVGDIDAERDSRFRAVGLTGFRIGKSVFKDPRRRVERILAAARAAEQSRIPRTFVLGADPEPVVERELRKMAWETEKPPDPAY